MKSGILFALAFFLIAGWTHNAQAADAVCGSAHGTTVSDNLVGGMSAAQACAVGSWIDIPKSWDIKTNQFRWTCNGTSGGANANCWANRQVTSACGWAHGGTPPDVRSSHTAPTKGLCRPGSIPTTPVAGTAIIGISPAWRWDCQGPNSTPVQCETYRHATAQPAACGFAADVPFGNNRYSTPPPPNEIGAMFEDGPLYPYLCRRGTPSAITASGPGGPWSWTCLSPAGNASCQQLGPDSTTSKASYIIRDAEFCFDGSCFPLHMLHYQFPGVSAWLRSDHDISPAPPRSVAGTPGVTPTTLGIKFDVYKYFGPPNNQYSKILSVHRTIPFGKRHGLEFNLGTVPGFGGTPIEITPSTSASCCGSPYDYPTGASPWKDSRFEIDIIPPPTEPVTEISVRIYANDGRDANDTNTAHAYANFQVTYATPVNGSCGSANGVARTSAPSSGLCSAGTASAVSGSGPWTWTCAGSGGGSTASCSAPLLVAVVNGACSGTAGACTSGTAASDNGLIACGTTRTWNCNGSGGGTNASCSIANPSCAVNGSCGTSNGGTFTTAPSTNLCVAGTVTPITTNPTTYTWSCNGSGGGSNASCTANRRVNAVCGVANTVPTATSPSSGLCSTGSAGAVTNPPNQWNWTCSGINGGTNASCSAPRIIHGTCGPSNGSNVYVAPTSGLCTTGTATTVSGAGPFNWNCNGINGGTNASCSANLSVNGACGPAHGTFSATAPTSGLCSAGSDTGVTGTGPFTWNCSGLNGGTSIACSSNAIVQGSCGPANNTPSATAPATGLCATGTATAVTGTGPWNWSCTGSGGGTTSTCLAPPPPPPPSFGGACPT